ncbi:hypothetical protein KR059_003272 [Drosophila kikkawai]|nr:hypothetical protein KR059_003272 [Drosophila kikkawai]
MSTCSDAKDVDFMRCLHCQKVIRFSRCDPICLLRHVETDHPSKCTVNSRNEKIKRMHMLAAEHGISEERLSEISRKTGLSEEQMANKAEAYMKKKGYIPSSQVSGGGGEKGCCPNSDGGCEKEVAQRSKCYRLSIRRWVPGEGCIFCPCCGCQRRPMIKAASEIVTTRCCAAAIAVCWPLCLLPCLASSDNREYLYCSNCNAFLGIYEREKSCVRPSREFVTCCNSATPPPTPK